MRLRRVARLWLGGWQVHIQGGEGMQDREARTVGWGGGVGLGGEGMWTARGRVDGMWAWLSATVSLTPSPLPLMPVSE